MIKDVKLFFMIMIHVLVLRNLLFIVSRVFPCHFNHLDATWVKLLLEKVSKNMYSITHMPDYGFSEQHNPSLMS